MKKYFVLFLGFLFIAGPLYAEEIAVVYTGNSYASLFDCGHCPASVGGAVARRATVIEGLRNENTYCAVVDAGNFTAGGILDEFSVNQALDEQRTGLYLSAMGRIGYDAVCLGDDDLNFGETFLQKAATAEGLTLLSANVRIRGSAPYAIRRYGQVKVAFIGLTNPVVSQRLGRSADDYKKILKKTLASLKKKADLIVLLSNMGDSVNKEIIREFPQVKVVITSGNMTSAQPYEEIGDSVLCRPAYQGKEVRMVRMTVGSAGEFSWEFDQRPVGTDVAENEKIKETLPLCFSDNDCRSGEKGDGTCLKGGTMSASCEYPELKTVDTWVVTDTACTFCTTQYPEEFLKNTVPGISFNRVDFRDERGEALIRKYGVDTLPAFIIVPGADGGEVFRKCASFSEQKDDVALVKKEMTGIFMFLNREFVPSQVDVFADLSAPEFPQIVQVLDKLRREKGIKVMIHFLPPLKGEYPSAGEKAGMIEEETARLRAVGLKYPEKFWPYLLKRVSTLDDTWWVAYFEELGMDYRGIREVIRGEEFARMEKAENELKKELGVNRGTAILIDNKFIFQVFSLDEKELLSLLEYAGSPGK